MGRRRDEVVVGREEEGVAGEGGGGQGIHVSMRACAPFTFAHLLASLSPVHLNPTAIPFENQRIGLETKRRPGPRGSGAGSRVPWAGPAQCSRLWMLGSWLRMQCPHLCWQSNSNDTKLSVGGWGKRRRTRGFSRWRRCQDGKVSVRACV
eukprot:3875816-Rhodomonas_salina.1